MSHTPGPWHWDGLWLESEDPHKTVIEISQDWTDSIDVVISDDDASLIAAAPDLLAACEECRMALEPYDDIKPRDWITDRERISRAHEMAREAIAKAKEPKP